MNLDELLAGTLARGAAWSISICRDDDPAPIVSHEPSRLLRTASVAKVFVLIELAEQLASGALDPARLVERGSVAPVRDSGLWQALRVERLPVADLAVLVGAVSDNWATNALIEVCGLDRIQAVATALAPGGSMLHDHVRDERSGDVPPTLSQGCAGDWVSVMRRLHAGDGIDAAVRDQVLGWLAHGTDLSMVAGAFDLDPLAHDVEDRGLRLWHKTGTDRGVRADVGVVRAATVVSYAVLCNWPETDAGADLRPAVLATMRRIGDGIGSILSAGRGF